MKKQNFNMIEVVLAIAVIAIGMVSILGLFPIGLGASRDAMAKSYGADAADEFMHYLEKYLRQDWAVNSLNNDYLPTTEPADTAKDDFPLTDGTPLSITLYLHNTSDGIYKAMRYIDENANNQYDDGEVIDFEAIIAVWRERINIDGSLLDYAYGLKLNMEISWPARAPYSGRNKDEYVLELFNR